MTSKVAFIVNSDNSLPIIEEAIMVLKSYEIEYEIKTIKEEHELTEYAKAASENNIRVIIAGARGDANFTNVVAGYFEIPTVGIPMRSLETDNDVKEVFSVLQQTNSHAVANVALDGGTNAGILAVQILGTRNPALQQKMIDFKENLKNKIVNANKEVTKIQMEYKTN